MIILELGYRFLQLMHPSNKRHTLFTSTFVYCIVSSIKYISLLMSETN